MVSLLMIIVCFHNSDGTEGLSYTNISLHISDYKLFI